MKINNIVIENIEIKYIKKNLPKIKVGDFVNLGVYVQESGKERIQPFQGTVIACHYAGLNTTITIRQNFQGVGVERVFPIHAPCITDVKILRRSITSRSKLYYLRNRRGKSARLKEKFSEEKKADKKFI